MTQLAHSVLQLERAAARAWPPRQTVDVDGWTVRLSGSGSRRANSVLPLRFGGNVDTAIDRIEALYAAQKTRAYVQVVSIAEPEDLDAHLAARGYVHEEPCLLMSKPIDGVHELRADVEITPNPTDAWLSVYSETIDTARRAAVPAVLETVPRPRAFLLVRDGDAPLACALGVLSPDGISVVECVATRSAQRRSGAGTRVMDALEAWSARQGATTMALQVVEANAPARALYGKRGYVERGRYHYRYKDVD
jgi:ribosomal protein S18 acetylase RimI-like enzyme